jgi:uncharacterized protein (DUF433 family)
MLTVSAVSVIEVVSGLQRMARSAQLEQFLRALDAIEVLPVDTQSAVLAGQPVLRGTRLSVAYILRLLASGATVEEILQEYEGLTPEDIQACLLFAAETRE